MLRDALIALSLANLCFLRIWNELFNGKIAYYAKVAPTNQLLAVALNVLLLAGVLWTGAQLARRSGRPWMMRVARWMFILFVLVSLRVQFAVFSLKDRWGWPGGLLAALLLLAMLCVLFRWEQRVARVLAAALIIVSPFVAVTFYQDVAWAVRVRSMSFADQPPAAALPPRAGAPRVVWVIFDELDERLIFDRRPASVCLPEFDRLRAQSLYATRAFAPARMTEMAMPALISGRLISKAEPRGSSRLLVTFGDSGAPVAWSAQPNVFSSARALGFNTALVGWYHPYCREIGSSLTSCAWYDGPMLRGALERDASVAGAMRQQAANVLITTLGLNRLGVDPRMVNREEREEEVRDYLDILTHGQRLATDPGVGLLLVHLPVPHPIGIYDRARHDFKTSGESSYLDNLELADRALGELRLAMESAGLWDSSTVVVSGDHWWRAEVWSRLDSVTKEEAEVMPAAPDHRVPFLVKLAGQKEPLAFTPEMNTILTHDLLLAVLRGEVRTSQEAAAWLDQHRTVGDVPYNIIKR